MPTELDPGVGRRQQLREEVANHLRQLIISGASRPGDVLRLGPLAERLDMSITPVREALLLLAQDGWVSQEPNRGFKVAAIRRRDIEDSYLVGAFVAGELAARAAQQATPEQVRSLRALDEAIRTDETADGNHQSALNHRLHLSIYAIADSPRLTSYSEVASSFVPRRFWTTVPRWREFNRAGHKPIIDAIEQGDADLAKRAMSQHIVRAGELLLSHLDSRAFFSSASD